MANMSYCRFHNTLYDLRDCLGTVREHIDGEAEYATSDEEIEKFKMMVCEFVNFLNEHSLLDSENEVDGTVLDDIAQSMEHGYDED